MWASVGKISGRVVDAETGDPIPGVNILVVGTITGATTNIDGEFFILNLPVGTYDLRVTCLGYETQNVTGIPLGADETYELDLHLNETVMMAEEVTITAERDVVKREFSSTIRSVTAEEIVELPVITYRDAIARTAGAVGSDDNIHIRGGRRDEILYLIDGLQVKDPQFQRRALDVSSSAIAEMQVMTAGFNAEYGEAQSAVVNLVVNEGGQNYHGQVKHVMDVNNISNYQDYDHTEASISGPEYITTTLLPRLGVDIPGQVNMFASGTAWGRNANEWGTYIDTDRWFRHQLTDIFGTDVRKNESYVNSNVKMTYNSNRNYKVSLGWNQTQQWINPYWYRMSHRFPDDFSLEQQSIGVHNLSSIQGLLSDATDLDNLFTFDDDGDGRTDEEALNWVDDDGDGLVDEDLQYYSFNANNSLRTEIVRDQQFNAVLNHTLNKKTFYTFRISHYEADRTLAGGNKPANEQGRKSEPFVDMPDEAGVYNQRYDLGEPFTDWDGDGMYDYNNPNNSTTNVDGFYIAGDGLAGNYQQLVPDWANFNSRTMTAKFDLTSQVTNRHQLKSGLEYNYYNVASEDRPYPSILNDGEGIYTDVYRYYPSAGAVYMQDKMEFSDIIINAGIRLDYWRIGGEAIRDVKARDSTLSNYVDYEPPSKDGEMYVSPRLGIAYSVTERDVFHFNYGYFYQRGRQDFYFTAANQLQTGGTPIVGNPDLEPMKTIAYELGVRHQFGLDFLLDVSTYYKDIKNWIQTAAQNQLYSDLYGWVPSRSNAAIYYNADYASVRGFEFNLSKDYSSRFSGRLTYTISWATGKNSYNIGSDVTRSNYIDPQRETPLGWDRRHQIVANLAYDVPLKGRPFSRDWLLTGWNVNVLSQALSGLPYTPTNANGTNVDGQEFAENSPWSYTTDLNVSRAFRTGNLKWRALLEVRNLFDRKNVIGWDPNQYTLDTYNGGNPGYINDNSSPNYGQNPAEGADPNPDAWDIPRLIRFGLGVEF